MKKAFPNQRLREERELRGWSQKYVAAQIGAERYYMSRWERGVVCPSSYYRQRLCALYGKSAKDLGLLSMEQGSPDRSEDDSGSTPAPSLLSSACSSPPFWNIPYGRNPFFTGREQMLTLLHEKLQADHPHGVKLPLTLCGLGGIGKTQTAIEYAYRYRAQYQAVLWVRADTSETLVSDYSRLATLMQLPEKDEQERTRLVEAVKHWLSTTSGWLLIFDNVEDLELIGAVLPGEHRGHVLLTSRSQVMSTFAEQISLEKMTAEEGALFLLRRARLISPDASLRSASSPAQLTAQELVSLMDGVPLALDQAGAYIEETACGIAGYCSRYRTRRTALLNVRGSTPDHSQSIGTTLSLSLQKIHQLNRAAAELLQFCAFLHPDAIPEELFIQGASYLGPVLQPVARDLLSLDAVISDLRKFSLVQRNSDTCTLTIHRLVQDVIKDEMDEQTRMLWIEQVIQAVNQAFPDATFASWSRCQRLLPHVLECLTLSKQHRVLPIEAARLFDQAGTYLRENAQYQEARSLYQHALTIREQTLESLHPDIAHSLHNLALVYNEQDEYSQGESLLLRALDMYRHTVGEEHVVVAACLTSLAMLYDNQGKFDQSEPLYYQALAIYERVVDPLHPDIASCLNNLGWLYLSQAKYAQAEPLYQRSLYIRRHVLEPQHPDIATSLNLLGWLYFAQGKYAQAEPLLQEALTIREQNLGTHHPDVAGTLNQLAELYRVQSRYAQAEVLHKRALSIREDTLGPQHRDTAQSMSNLGRLYTAQGMYEEAERLYLRALTVREQTLGPGHLSVAISFNDLAELSYAWHRYDEAEHLSQRALAILAQAVGPLHPHVATSLHIRAKLLCLQNQYAEAEALYKRVLVIREQSQGTAHPDVARCLEDYASMLRLLRRDTEALALESRAQSIQQQRDEAQTSAHV